MTDMKTGKHLDLPTEFELETDFNNPIFSDEGSNTLLAVLPPTPQNFQLFGFPERTDSADKPVERRLIIQDGAFQRAGNAVVLDSEEDEGINITMQYDEGEFWDKINNVRMPDLPWGTIDFGSVANALAQMDMYMNNPAYNDYDFCVFPVLLDAEKDETRTVYYVLNQVELTPYSQTDWRLVARQTSTEWIKTDSGWTQVTNPAGYSISPFFKLHKLLKRLFAIFGYTLTDEPFSGHIQLKRLCVLNNTRDAIVSGRLVLSQLVPDMTVNEFLDTLFAKFGAVTFINSDSHTVSIKFIRDILSTSATEDLTKFRASKYKNYNEKGKQLKLTSGKSFDMPDFLTTAKTSEETIEDFVRVNGTDFYFTSEIFYYHQVRTILWYNPKTKHFFRINNKALSNYDPVILSSSFFDYDKRLPNFEYLELEAKDEQVPLLEQHFPSIPAYLAKFRNINSSLAVNDKSVEEKMPTCLLSFLFCMTFPGSTGQNGGYLPPFGNSFAKDVEGNPVSGFNIDLCYIGENGLFNRFFKEYDAHLRHALQKTEVEYNMPNFRKMNLKMLEPITSDFQRYLIETYNVKIGKEENSPFALRTLRLRVPNGWDINAEYPIIAPNPAQWHWKLVNDMQQSANAYAQTFVGTIMNSFIHYPTDPSIPVQVKIENVSIRNLVAVTVPDENFLNPIFPQVQQNVRLFERQYQFRVTLSLSGTIVSPEDYAGQPNTLAQIIREAPYSYFYEAARIN